MRTKILSIVILLAVPFFGMAQPFERGTRIQKNQRGIIESAEFLSALLGQGSALFILSKQVLPKK